MALRWGTWEDTLLALLGRAGAHPAPSARHYQLLLAPTFGPPSCLEVEETAAGVVLALVILLDRQALHTAFAATLPSGATDPAPAEVAKGRCWEDVAELAPEQEAAFRRLRADLDPCGLDDRNEGGRDGIVLWLRCEAPGLSRTICMWSPTRQAAPAHHRWVTALLDLAAASFGERECLDYLASVRQYLRY